MALTLTDKGFVVKKTVYVDMDGVLVDFNSSVNRLPAKTWEAYKEHPEDAPGVFALMDPIPGAIDAVNCFARSMMSIFSPRPLGKTLPHGLTN